MLRKTTITTPKEIKKNPNGVKGFPRVSHVFRIAQKLQNPNLQCGCGHRDNNDCEIVSEELSDYPF